LKLSYFKNGKLKSVELPKKNNKLPKTKRLRKKKYWTKCGDCNVWFKTYTQTTGTRNDGKKVCHSCLKERIKKTRPDLF
jgi:ribosomal protein L34E